MTQTLSAVYADIEHARQTIHDLIGHGFPQNDISLITGDSLSGSRQSIMTQQPEGNIQKSEGSSGGALLGGLTGLLIGLGALVIPGIGAAVAAGPLFGIIGAGVGAITGGILGALINAGIPEQSAGYLAEAVRRGNTLVLVTADDKLIERATQIVNRHDPLDMTKAVEAWKTEGWIRFDPSAEPLSAAELAQERTRIEQFKGQAPTASVG
jgi:hypothetical protein